MLGKVVYSKEGIVQVEDGNMNKNDLVIWTMVTKYSILGMTWYWIKHVHSKQFCVGTSIRHYDNRRKVANMKLVEKLKAENFINSEKFRINS